MSYLQSAHPVFRRFHYMLRPADCQIHFALPCKISLTRPTMSRRSLPSCILSVPRTAKQHSVVPPTNQSTSSFSVWIQGCWVVSCRSWFCFWLCRLCILRPSDILLSTEQPESTPRVSYPTTLVSTDCRIGFAVVCRVVFKVFPCRLCAGSGPLTPELSLPP